MNNKILLTGILILALGACKPDDPDPGNGGSDDGTVNITLKFNPLFKGSPLSWSDYYMTGSKDTISFDRIKFLMSNFILEKENGELYQIPDAYAYLTLKDGRDSVVFPKIPKGKYKSIRFKVGLDSAINHSDPAKWPLTHPLSPSLNEMHWGWAGGYIFNVIEGYYKNNGSIGGFTYHIALERNSRVHVFNTDYEISGNGRFVFNVNADMYFDNAVNFSIKSDGSVSHSGDVDPIMDKFMQNVNGVIDFVSYK